MHACPCQNGDFFCVRTPFLLGFPTHRNAIPTPRCNPSKPIPTLKNMKNMQTAVSNNVGEEKNPAKHISSNVSVTAAKFTTGMTVLATVQAPPPPSGEFGTFPIMWLTKGDKREQRRIKENNGEQRRTKENKGEPWGMKKNNKTHKVNFLNLQSGFLFFLCTHRTESLNAK